MRALPFNGTEWSYMLKDDGYDEYGFKLGAKNDDDESKAVLAQEKTSIEMQSIGTEDTSIAKTPSGMAGITVATNGAAVAPAAASSGIGAYNSSVLTAEFD